MVSTVRDVKQSGGSADSRFFINTSDDAGWADDRYAAFGLVESGMDFVTNRMQKVPVKPPQNRPVVDVRIVASGVLTLADGTGPERTYKRLSAQAMAEVLCGLVYVNAISP